MLVYTDKKEKKETYGQCNKMADWSDDQKTCLVRKNLLLGHITTRPAGQTAV